MTDARTLLDLLPTPVALVDTHLEVIAANRAFVGPFGGGRPSADVHGRADLWTALGVTIARMQPAALVGRCRWVGGEPEPRPWDVHITRVEADRFLVYADDVSRYVAAESILSGVRGYVEQVLNHIDRAVVGLDTQMRVTFFNRAQAELWRRAGRTAAVDAVGEPVADTYTVFDAARWRAITDGFARGAGVRHERVRWAVPAGTIDLDVSVLPLHEAGGVLIGAVCVTEVLG